MQKLKPLDVVIAALAAGLVLFLFIRIYSTPADNASVVIRVNEDTWRYSLDVDREIAVPGPLGETFVHIENGQAHVEESPCKNKFCIAAGEINRPGEWIVCLPNEVFIMIEGAIESDELEVDDIVF
jgi:hypothetical protein